MNFTEICDHSGAGKVDIMESQIEMAILAQMGNFLKKTLTMLLLVLWLLSKMVFMLLKRLFLPVKLEI